MPGAKIRGKSAVLQQNDNNSTVSAGTTNPTNLLKIESVVPTITNRINNSNKFIRRSNSTLSPAYFRNINQNRNSILNNPNNIINKINGNSANDIIDENQESIVFQNGGNLRVKRTPKEKDKLPDRINLDRRGLTSIPFIEEEQNLRLLSLQHNLINVFQVPNEKDINIIAPIQTPQQTEELKKQVNNNTNTTTKKTMQPSNLISNRNVLPTSENKIQLGINPLILNNHHQKSFLLKKSNSFINGYNPNSTAISTSNQNLLTKKSKLCHMMSFSADSTTNGNLTMNKDMLMMASANSTVLSNKVTNISLPAAPPYTWPSFSLSLQNLVFLDLYDNQIDRISNLDGLKSLTVLLLGKNRITDISGIVSLKTTIRVLDLHGNKISNISQKICQLQELKSLNLAGNSLRHISTGDFAGMFSLKELNLKRNRIKKISGFDDLRNLERLWLCHNDLQKIDDMSCIAKAVNLKEVTIENNPISLGGDCVSFLVSYLPNLMLLSQMQVTEQVKRAANAWRKSKEISDTNYLHLSSDVCHNIRREEVISNARTSWELLRTQQIKINTTNKQTPTNEDGISNLSENLTANKKNTVSRQKTMINLSNKDKKLSRSSSQDNSTNDIIENITSNPDDFFRLPPILAPFLEKTFSSDKLNSQGSSLGPNIDSSSSYYSSDNEENNNKKVTNKNEILENDTENSNQKIENDVKIDVSENEDEILLNNIPIESNVQQNNVFDELPIDPSPTPPSPIQVNHQLDKISNVSVKTSSESSSVITNSSDDTVRSSKIRSANPNRKYFGGSLVRAQTARGSCLNHHNQTNNNNSNNSSNISNNSSNTQSGNIQYQFNSTTTPSNNKKISGTNDREREQGGDYLIEICGRYLNVYGLGAIKFIDKQWNVQKANDVHTVKFSYINFNSIAVILYRIKVRFPNAENFIFRETNITCLGQLNALSEIQGINSLVIDPEGNTICNKEWRNYAIYRLSHWGLKQINGTEISEEEIQVAEQMYIGLSDLVVWSLPETLLQPLLTRLRLEENCLASKMTAKDWLIKADPSLKCVVGKEALQWKKTNSIQEEINARQKGRTQLTIMMENTCNAVEKLQKLETLWTTMLVEMIRNTLLDYSQIDAYVKNLMEEIMK